ncbi:MAG: hypothetical protein WBO73_16495 [Gammaproteobacteria bacterium]
MTEFALLLFWTRFHTLRDRVLMTADATRVKGCFVIGWLIGRRWLFTPFGLRLMAFVTTLHHGIRWLNLVVAGFALGNFQIGVFLMSKRHHTQLCLEFYIGFFWRNR